MFFTQPLFGELLVHFLKVLVTNCKVRFHKSMIKFYIIYIQINTLNIERGIIRRYTKKIAILNTIKNGFFNNNTIYKNINYI